MNAAVAPAVFEAKSLDDLKEAVWLNVLGQLSPEGQIFSVSLLRQILDNSMLAAHTIGHAEAEMQHALVLDATQQQFNDRLDNTGQALLAALMEQQKLETLTLNLDALQTVFSRKSLAVLSIKDDTNCVRIALSDVTR